MTDNDVKAAASDCVHCGFCLPACPTYQLWGEEMDSPRGRIHLLTQVLDGADLTDAGASHFDRCLGCMACMTACPSGVRYDTLIESARELTAERGSRADRLTRAAIFAVFPYPRRLRALTAPLRVLRRTGLDRMLAGRLPGAAGAALRLAPPLPRAERLPERVPAVGPRRAVVGMLTGCVQSVFFADVNAATARVLAAEGCDVIVPRGQGCCGALSSHAGRRAEAAEFERRTIAAFSRADVDAIVVNSAGCGSAMKSYAGEFGGRVRDLSEFLVDLGPVAVRHPVPAVAAYHDACHLLHAQRISAQPRALLHGIPGLELRELADAGSCCGSAGVYNLLQPQAAASLGSLKADAVVASGASLLISANPGCSLQIAAALSARGHAIQVAHPAQVLDASIASTSVGGPSSRQPRPIGIHQRPGL